MKKYGMLAAVLACLALLPSCQSKQEQVAPYQTTDLQALVNAGAFSEELETVDGDTAFALYRLADYGLTREDLADCAVLRSAGGTCEEAAVLVLAEDDQKQVSQVEQALKDYVQGQISSNENYRPNEIPKLDEAVIDSRDGTVLMVVANDYSAVKAALG
jgi:hypothetical protein